MPEMKIAMLSLHSCPLGQLGTRDTGGMNVYVRELSRAMGEMGHRVDVFTRAHDPKDAQLETPFDNVRLIHIKAGRVEDMGKMAQLSHLQEFTRNMAEFNSTDGSRYDLIHSHYWLSGLAGRQFSESWGIPQVVMLHTLGAIKNSLPVGEKEPDIRLNAERGVIHAARQIVAATQKEKEQLANLYGANPGKISIVPCGVNTGLFKPVEKQEARRALGLDKTEKIVLSVGRIEPLKGLDQLVKGFGMLSTRHKRLLIIGGDEHSGTEIERLKRLSGLLGIEKNLEFLGTVKQDRLPLYYAAADVTAVASYYESFCLIILESLACGTPVVSTNVGVARQVIIDGWNGIVVQDNDPAELAQGITQTVSASFRQEEIRASVSRYAWPAVTRQIAAVYELVLQSEPVMPRQHV